MVRLPKAYEPHAVEGRWARVWLERECFRADAHSPRPPYSIVIPPPNVTGALHIGHALNVTLQDVLVRYRRMDGHEVLWVPGTDHAGIATQNVVERELAAEGLDRQRVGREAFLERVWRWRERYGRTIIEQLQRLGASCDWSRERFTMDEGFCRAVREAFVRLYEDGLIYQGDYIINWCPRCQTALSDLEVEHQEVKGSLWYVRYPLADGRGFLTVATTRPETMLGDTALAVNPRDGRYRQLVGREAVLPLVGRRLPIVVDEYVDVEFGTGVLKVTPAHDPHDFELGARHGLPRVQVIDARGRMNAAAGRYAGLDRFECRRRVVEDLRAEGLLEREEPYEHAVGCCYRCRTIVEPLVSRQWFVRMRPLAEPAIRAVEEGRTRIVPEGWTKVYFGWLRNIRDWCISRQIWWGHRLPAWHCEECGRLIVSRRDPDRCERCGAPRLRQEEDVLDTWFSSALWPFATLGWPERTPELERFYPTSALVTGFDILFFWVARMMMMGLYFTGQVPFRDVYIHALVRDMEGQKMSKSRGNVIDPLVMMDRYGTDALRFTLSILAAQGRDIKLGEERIEGYRHFMNKIWNAARFVLMSLDDWRPQELPERLPPEALAERWVLSRLQRAVTSVREALDGYRFDGAASELYRFVWHELCDWYLELAKVSLRDERRRGLAQTVLHHALGVTLRLLHPFIPFITEELWHHLSPQAGLLCRQPFPRPEAAWLDPGAESDMEALIQLIVAIRNLRAEVRLPPSRRAVAVVAASGWADLVRRHADYVVALARLERLEVAERCERPPGSIGAVVHGMEAFLCLEGVVDLEAERGRLRREIAKVERELAAVQDKLQREEFLRKAPPQVVDKERRRHRELAERLERLRGGLRRLEGTLAG